MKLLVISILSLSSSNALSWASIASIALLRFCSAVLILSMSVLTWPFNNSSASTSNFLSSLLACSTSCIAALDTSALFLSNVVLSTAPIPIPVTSLLTVPVTALLRAVRAPPLFSSKLANSLLSLPADTAWSREALISPVAADASEYELLTSATVVAGS